MFNSSPLSAGWDQCFNQSFSGFKVFSVVAGWCERQLMTYNSCDLAVWKLVHIPCTPTTAMCELRTGKKDFFFFSVINLKWNIEVTTGWVQHSLTCAVAVELQTCLSSLVWGEKKRRKKGTYAHYLYASLISGIQIHPINNRVISMEGALGHVCYFILSVYFSQRKAISHL